MRTINITKQEYKNYGIVDKLSYEILPFDDGTDGISEPQEEIVISGISEPQEEIVVSGISEPQEEIVVSGNFPFNYILYNNDLEVINSIGYLSEEEFNDWSVYQLMDNKICAKIGINI